MDKQEEICLAAFQKGARPFLMRLTAGGKEQGEAFLRYGKRDAGFYFIQYAADSILPAELARKVMIKRAAVEKDDVRGGEQLLPADLFP